MTSVNLDNLSLKQMNYGSLSITGSYTELSDDFTVMFWIRNPNVSSETIMRVAGTNNLDIKFSSATTMVVGGNSVIIDNCNDGNWHHFSISRSDGLVYVKQNKSQKGNAITDSTTYGGTGVAIGTNQIEMADPRVYTKAISQNALNYYYDNVKEGGDKLLPI